MNYQRAHKHANDLLNKLNIHQPPVDVRGIAKSLEIMISEVPNDDDNMSGLIMKNAKMALIGLNATHHENRKRFTVAHELGHYTLHTKEIFVDPEKNFHLKYRKNKKNYDPEESEANTFAAELLMPENWIKDDFDILLNKLNLGIESIIFVLSEKYDVSAQAMQIRLDTLSLT